MFERNRIAETLRNAREKQGLSLEQAAAAAGIPLQYLRLLEGETNVKIGVSDELYLVPFFRKYARFFGIDAEEMLPEFLGIVQQIPGEGSPPIRLAYRPRWGFLWKPAAVLATIGVAVVLLLRQAPTRPAVEDTVASADGERMVESLEPPATVPSETPNETATPVPAVVTEPSASAVPSVVPSRATPHVVPSGTHELQIAAVQEAWLSLAVDDQPAKQYLLRAGETRTWSALQFTLTVGNAGGITVALDGRELPPIGAPGRVVRNLRLPANAASPSPAPRPS